MNAREIVGWNLRRLRVQQDIAQERLAYDSGVDRSYLGGVERGEENPTVEVLERLSATLGVKLIELFQEPGKDAPAPQPLRPGRRAK